MTGHRGGRRSRKLTQSAEGSNTEAMSKAQQKVVPMARPSASATPSGGDGYKPAFERDQASTGIIQGDRIKFSGSNVWIGPDGKPLNLSIQYLVTGARIGLQRWHKKDGKAVPEVILDKPLPDVDDLNAQTDPKTWEKGLDGKPRAPWNYIYVIHLVNEVTGQMFTYVNSTTGTRIAYGKLVDQVCTAQSLRGEDVVPVIRLSTTPMKSQFGERPRPAYEVVELRSIGRGALAGKQAPQLEHKPVEEEFYDDATGDL
jgi:hypothetical protein